MPRTMGEEHRGSGCHLAGDARYLGDIVRDAGIDAVDSVEPRDAWRATMVNHHMMIRRVNGALRTVMPGAVIAFASGCGEPTNVSTDVTVVPSAATFAVDTYATFVVSNQTRETIHLDRCGERVQAGLDRRVGADWENEIGAFCILSYYAGPLALAPGESVTDSVLVRSAGTFRLFVGYGRGEQRILYQARSGAFGVD